MLIKTARTLVILRLCHASSETNRSLNTFNHFAVNTELDIASNVGKNIINRGGNAVDAAIGAMLTIGIVNSFSSGIGGGGFMLVKPNANNNEDITFLDFRETAPELVDLKQYSINPESAKTSGAAVAVPGEIAGMYLAHKRFGKLEWREVFKEPIDICFRGFKASPKLIEKLYKNKDAIFNDKGLRETFTINGKLIKKGAKVYRKNLGNTLKKISEDPLSFYHGELANHIANFIKNNGGTMQKSDLEKYEVKQRPILKGSFYDFTVFTTSLPTSGVFIIQALNILEKLNIFSTRKKTDGSNSYLIYHSLIEIFKFISSERGNLGDPEFIKTGDKLLRKLMSEESAISIAKKYTVDGVLDMKEYGLEKGFKEDHGTTHLNVVDNDGMVVLVTSTINLEFGSKLLDPETGIIFNNQIDDFYIPGVDNFFNLAPMENNIIKPFKRPYSSAAPTLLVSDNEIIAIGASGGTRIPTAIITTLAYYFLGNTLEDSISLCRIHNQLVPHVTFIEPTLPNDVVKRLQELGHQIEISELNSYFTAVQALVINKNQKKDKSIIAVSDVRKDGASAGK